MAKVQIKRVGVFSYAKITAVTLTVFGLIVGVIYGLIFMVVGGAMMAGGRNQGAAGASSLVIGLVMMIAIPVFYGIIGFVGGIELELENVDDTGYAAPPAPNWGDQPPYTPGQQQQYPY